LDGRGAGLRLAALGAPLQRGLLHAAAILGSGGASPGVSPHDGAPAGVVARDVLSSLDASSLLTGPHSPTDGEELQRRAQRLAGRPISKELSERLVAQLRSRPDEEVAALEPLRLADRWGVDRRELLRLFLHATDAGLLNLEWSLRCPACRVAAKRVPGLGDIPDELHCGCGAVFEADLTHRVEAVFHVHPAIRKVEQGDYCVAGTQARPHVFAQLVATRERPCTITAPLPPIDLVASLGGFREPLSGPMPGALTFTVHREGVRVERGSGPAGEGGTPRTVRTELEGAPTALALERAGWHADWVSATLLATLPEFHELFSGEAPRSRHEVSVGSLTLLFTDLKGSTALYQRLGDARAFSLVEEHFDRLAAEVDRHGGALVKTMGDAVMAVFDQPQNAIRAAFAMHEAIASSSAAEEGLLLKLGIHTGTCLAIRANGRLDFFGNAVNLAARAQAQSQGSDVVLTDAVVNAPGVAPLLEGHHREPFEAKLKGIDAPQRLWRLAIEAKVHKAG
ncbi:MAG: adenylate/guanylate cyclase domain-containing protein, partial [Deltaproteobacteria bacterium]